MMRARAYAGWVLQVRLGPVTVHPELFELIQLGRTHNPAPGSHLNTP